MRTTASTLDNIYFPYYQEQKKSFWENIQDKFNFFDTINQPRNNDYICFQEFVYRIRTEKNDLENVYQTIIDHYQSKTDFFCRELIYLSILCYLKQNLDNYCEIIQPVYPQKEKTWTENVIDFFLREDKITSRDLKMSKIEYWVINKDSFTAWAKIKLKQHLDNLGINKFELAVEKYINEVRIDRDQNPYIGYSNYKPFNFRVYFNGDDYQYFPPIRDFKFKLPEFKFVNSKKTSHYNYQTIACNQPGTELYPYSYQRARYNIEDEYRTNYFDFRYKEAEKYFAIQMQELEPLNNLKGNNQENTIKSKIKEPLFRNRIGRMSPNSHLLIIGYFNMRMKYIKSDELNNTIANWLSMIKCNNEVEFYGLVHNLGHVIAISVRKNGFKYKIKVWNSMPQLYHKAEIHRDDIIDDPDDHNDPNYNNFHNLICKQITEKFDEVTTPENGIKIIRVEYLQYRNSINFSGSIYNENWQLKDIQSLTIQQQQQLTFHSLMAYDEVLLDKILNANVDINFILNEDCYFQGIQLKGYTPVSFLVSHCRNDCHVRMLHEVLKHPTTKIKFLDGYNNNAINLAYLHRVPVVKKWINERNAKDEGRYVKTDLPESIKSFFEKRYLDQSNQLYH